VILGDLQYISAECDVPGGVWRTAKGGDTLNMLRKCGWNVFIWIFAWICPPATYV